VFSEGCFNKCKTKRKAVLLPIPGKRETSFTAFSNIFDEKSIVGEINTFHQKKEDRKQRKITLNF